VRGFSFSSQRVGIIQTTALIFPQLQEFIGEGEVDRRLPEANQHESLCRRSTPRPESDEQARLDYDRLGNILPRLKIKL